MPPVTAARAYAEHLLERLQTSAAGVVDAFPEIGVALGVRDSAPRAMTRVTTPDVRVANGHHAARPADATGSDKGGQGRMLRALSETLKDGLSRRELGALSGVKASGGTFGTYLSRLRLVGHIEDGGAGIRITDAGRAVVGPVSQRTGRDLLDFWSPQLGDKPAAMLKELFHTQDPIERDDLAAAVGLAGNAGTFGTYLSRLVSRGLVDKVGRGAFTVSEAFRQ